MADQLQQQAGWAFATYSSPEEAQFAVSAIDGVLTFEVTFLMPMSCSCTRPPLPFLLLSSRGGFAPAKQCAAVRAADRDLKARRSVASPTKSRRVQRRRRKKREPKRTQTQARPQGRLTLWRGVVFLLHCITAFCCGCVLVVPSNSLRRRWEGEFLFGCLSVRVRFRSSGVRFALAAILHCLRTRILLQLHHR